MFKELFFQALFQKANLRIFVMAILGYPTNLVGICVIHYRHYHELIKPLGIISHHLGSLRFVFITISNSTTIWDNISFILSNHRLHANLSQRRLNKRLIIFEDLCPLNSRHTLWTHWLTNCLVFFVVYVEGLQS